jgi:protein SFI1
VDYRAIYSPSFWFGFKLTSSQTTNQQIGKARDSLLLRLSLQRWRTLTASRGELHHRVKSLSDNRCLRSAMSLWKAKLKEKDQAKWRHEIRHKMKTIKDKVALRLRKDAWAKWRQSYLSHLSGQHYTEHLLFRFYCRWKERLSGLDELEHAAELHLGVVEQRWVGRCWNLWKRASDMRNAERLLLRRINLRLMGSTMDIWRKHA